jgi:hypothetical protein
MQSTTNQLVSYSYGGKYDIRMTLRDYVELTNSIRQHDLSNAALLKFKHLYQVNGLSGIALLVAPIVPAYIVFAFLRGRVNRGSADLKWGFPVFFTTYIGGLWYFSNKEISRRLYTELLTDPGNDGRIIRQGLRDQKPNLWRHLSRQMDGLGYAFPEMVEQNKTAIPQALV